MQHITISGRIGKDAETREASGQQVTSFNVAVDQGFGDKKKTNWFRISVWGKKGAGAAPYLLKGGVVTVVGEFDIGEFNGDAQYNIRASDFTLPPKASGSRDDGLTHQNQDGWNRKERPSGASRAPVEPLDDDVPFLTMADDNQRKRVI